MAVLGGRDAQRVRLGDRFSQQVDQRVADAWVRDTPGCEQQLQDGSRFDAMAPTVCGLPTTAKLIDAGAAALQIAKSAQSPRKVAAPTVDDIDESRGGSHECTTFGAGSGAGANCARWPGSPGPGGWDVRPSA